MLSLFIKKLLFSRQFSMSEGSLEILGSRYSVLPSDILDSLDDNQLKALKRSIQDKAASFMKKLSIRKDDFPEIVHDFFNLFGMGELHLVEFDSKSSRVRITDKPEISCRILMIMLEAVFGYIYERQVEVHILKNEGLSCEFRIS